MTGVMRSAGHTEGGLLSARKPDPPSAATARARQSQRPATIFGRRDVALMPWIAIALTSAGVLASTWLHGPGHRDPVVIGLALLGVVTGTALSPIQDTWIGRKHRRSLAVYLISSAGLVASLAIFALRDGGL